MRTLLFFEQLSNIALSNIALSNIALSEMYLILIFQSGSTVEKVILRRPMMIELLNNLIVNMHI